MCIRWTARWILITLVAGAHVSGGMELVRNGKPTVRVIIDARESSGDTGSKEAPWTDRYAADLLVEWIRRMTGAELPIVLESEAGDSLTPAIYLGGAAKQRGLDLSDIPSPSLEGLRIAVDDDKALIAGQSGAATVRAVCRFLERLGCRFYFDSDYAEKAGWRRDLGKVIPRSRSLFVEPFTHSEKPGLVSRRFWGSSYSGNTLWRLWNGDGGISMQTGHAWQGFVSAKTYYSEHPEYFALRDGERVRGEWVCTANPDVRAIFVKKLLQQAKENPTGSFSISPPDNRGYCMCDECRALDDPDHIVASSGEVSMSARFMDFYRHVAAAVRSECPDVTLNFYAYADYTEPPRNGGKVPSNLVAWIAPIRYSRYHPIGSPHSPTRRELERVIDGWSDVVDKIAYRTYNFNLAESTVPFSKLSVLSHDMPYLKRKGCIAVNMETFTAWGLMGPHLYQSLRLMYDPDLDVEALMDDFWRNFYGPAAEPMKAYWLLIDKAFSTLPSEAGCFYSLHLVYTPENLARLKALLGAASTAGAEDDLIAARVRLARKGFSMAEDYVTWRNHVNRGAMAEAKAVSDRMYARSEQDAWCFHNKTSEYIRRFLKPVSDTGAKCTTAPNRLAKVLPDTWRLAYDPGLKGEASGYARPDFDDSGWTEMRTYSATLSEQRIPEQTTFMWARTRFTVPAGIDNAVLVFLDLDCAPAESKLFVNGKSIPTDRAGLKRRRPSVAEVADELVEGENTIALLLDHRRISENNLGGIVRSVLLCDVELEN